MNIVQLSSKASLVFLALVAAPSIFAAGGWYLLVPPRSGYDELKGYKILDTEPLSKWTQQGAYDSASDCEAVKNGLLSAERMFYSKSAEDYGNALSAKKDAAVLMVMRSATETSNANVEALMASRCIKSDDPRLGK